MSKELKPCPFCGGEAELHDGSFKNGCLCRNEKCMLFARIFPIEQWNTRPDYEEPEAEVGVKYPINPDSGGTLCYEHPLTGAIIDKITEAVNQHDFIGFKYEDGTISAQPRRYQMAMTTAPISRCSSEEGVLGDKVLTPTHVLFRGAK